MCFIDSQLYLHNNNHKNDIFMQVIVPMHFTNLRVYVRSNLKLIAGRPVAIYQLLK